MAYMSRLGLWGSGTQFKDFWEFIQVRNRVRSGCPGSHRRATCLLFYYSVSTLVGAEQICACLSTTELLNIHHLLAANFLTRVNLLVA